MDKSEMLMSRCFLPAALGLAVLTPDAALGDDAGRISGQFDGAPIEFEISLEHPHSMVHFDVSRSGGYTDVDIDILALSEGLDGREGAWLMLHFEASGDIAAEDMNSDMLADATLMIVEDWPYSAEEPKRGWIAEISDFDQIEIASLSLSADVRTIAGHVSSDRLCLHDVRDGDFVPVRESGSPVCQAGAFDFAATSGGAQLASSQAATVDVDVLGRIEGTVGDRSFQWLTILRDHGTGSASWERLDAHTTALRIQAHSPASAHFLRQDVLSIEIWSGASVPEGEAIPADVTFFESTTSPLVLYTSGEGTGSAEAVISNLSLQDERSEVAFEVSGQLCRAEGDCRPFRVVGATELLHDGDL